MPVILTFLRNLRLSFVQWLCILGAATIGILVLLLKAQGRELHRAKLGLLDSRLKAREASAAADTTAALAAYKKDKEAFLNAGGKL